MVHVEDSELDTGNVFRFHIDGNRWDLDIGHDGGSEVADGVVGASGGEIAIHAILGDVHLDADLLSGVVRAGTKTTDGKELKFEGGLWAV